MKMFKCIKNDPFYFFGFLILSVVIFANIFPKGYVFSGGDTIQFIDAKNNFSSLFYDWNGVDSFFYLIFFCLSKLGVSDSAQLSWYLGIFIFGSYISFNIFIRIFFQRMKSLPRMILSLIYALNIYTLYVFSSNWGYSYFQFLYIFIPILVGLFMKLLMMKEKIYIAWFSLALFFASSGFGNPAFALSLGIMLFFSVIILVAMRAARLDRETFSNLAVLALFSTLVNLYWIGPLVPQLRSGVDGIFSSTVIDFNYWLSDTSNPIINTLRMIHYSQDYFPDNFPYARIYFLKGLFNILAFLPIILIFWGMMNLKRMQSENRRLFLFFSGLLIVLVILVARVREPFLVANHYLFNLWGMNTLRGYDKTAIFVPFVLISLLTITFYELSGGKIKRWLYAAIIIILLTPLPFYFGKLQQNMSYRFSNASPQNKDFRKSRLSFLVRIPNDYYKIRNIINSDPEKAFVATLPYSSNDGSGISNFPKWKMYGADITQYLYNKDLIEANATKFGQWNFARAFNENNDGNDEWIIRLLGMMNAKYIIYHKDVPEDSFLNSEAKIKRLEKSGLIESLDDNEYFTLYRIRNDYVFPYISWQDDNPNMTPDIRTINRDLDRVKGRFLKADFSQLNRKKFEVKRGNNFSGKFLVLAEQYSPNWKAYLVKKNGEEIEIKNHMIARGYANGWMIKDQESGEVDHILIEYYLTRLMIWNMFISVSAALFLTGYLLRYYYVKQGEKADK